MNENLNLVEILKDCPEGTEFYHAGYGRVWFYCIDLNLSYPIRLSLSDEIFDHFGVTSKGTINKYYNGECLLFPSKEQRDWSKFTAPWYDTIDWLEKQGEQKKQVHFPKFTFDDVLALQCCMETVKKVQEDKELYEQLNLIHNKIYDAYCLGKQGETSPILSNSSNIEKNEQKSDDKVEPKFHEGDWIIHQGTENIYQVVSIIDNKYRLKYSDNYTVQECADVDRCARLWDITKDAKDGDVLANDHHILILKELVYDWSSNGTPYSVKAYCGIKPNGNFEIGKDNWCFCGTLHILPATKEQRDALMKAMNDAGYEWDSEKKELKKEKVNKTN